MPLRMEEHILYGERRDRNLNPENESIGTMLFNSLKENGSNISQIDGVSGKKETFNDIFQSSCYLAYNLKMKGLRRGDVISVCSENRLELAVPVIAALYIGVVLAPLNPLYTKDELIHVLNITKPKLIFCSELSLNTVCDAIKKCHFVMEIILFGNAIPERPVNYKLTMYYEYILPLCPVFRPDDFKPDEFDSYNQTALVLNSSGTTGLPKGVQLSHSNVETYVRNNRNCNGLCLTERDVLLGLVPFIHAYGYGLLITSLIVGAKMVILPRFEERLFLSTIQKYKVSVLPTVSPLMVFLAKNPTVNNYDLSSVKSIFCSAAPLGEDVLKQVKKRLGTDFVYRVYGVTELSFVITVPPLDNIKPHSVGKLAGEAEAKVIDLETYKALGPNKVGELCFRGPQIMQGYYNNEKATRETIDPDGWLHTGDIAYYDEEGFLYIIDRIKEIIKYKAYQVSPAELEALILTHAGVKDAAVIGLADESCGELPMAFVVKQPGVNISEKDIVELVASKVSPHKRLRGGVKFVDSIPKNVSGKILRRILRQSMKSKL